MLAANEEFTRGIPVEVEEHATSRLYPLPRRNSNESEEDTARDVRLGVLGRPPLWSKPLYIETAGGRWLLIGTACSPHHVFSKRNRQGSNSRGRPAGEPRRQISLSQSSRLSGPREEHPHEARGDFPNRFDDKTDYERRGHDAGGGRQDRSPCSGVSIRSGVQGRQGWRRED